MTKKIAWWGGEKPKNSPNQVGKNSSEETMRKQIKSLILASCSVPALNLAAPLAVAQDESSDADEVRIEDQIIVTGRRGDQTVSSIPNSVTVIPLETLEKMFSVDEDLSSVLQFSVPGIAGQSSGLQSQAVLRGRTALIMVDGIPQNQRLFSAGYDIETIAPEAISRIEVLSGATSAFGFGSTGGVINYITKKADKEGFSGLIKARTEFQTADADPTREIYGQISAGFGDVGIIFGASFDQRGVGYSGDGAPLPNTNSLYGKDIENYHGAIDWDISPTQRLSMTGNYYRREGRLEDAIGETVSGDPDNDILSQAGPLDEFFVDFDNFYYGTPLVTGASLDFPLRPDAMKFQNYTLTYENDDVFGTSVSVSGLYHEFANQSTFFKFGENFNTDIGETIVADNSTREKMGLRFSAVTPLDSMAEGATLSWGADYLNYILDDAWITANSLTPSRLDNRSTPYIEQDEVGFYAQLEVPINKFILSGGIRQDSVDATLDDGNLLNAFGGGSFVGGDVSYDVTTFNASLVYDWTEATDVYFTYSQGVDITQLGRAASGQVSSAAELDPEAAKADSFEVGLKSRGSNYALQLAAYYSDSELASRTEVVTGGNARQIRQPEENYGLEGSFDYIATDTIDWGLIFNWSDGEVELPDGSKEPTQTWFVSPTSLSSYLNWAPTDWFDARAETYFVLGDDRFPAGSGFARGTHEDLADLALMARFKHDKFGSFEIGIDNVFDQVYVAPGDRAINLASAFYPVPGRTISLTYRKSFGGS